MNEESIKRVSDLISEVKPTLLQCKLVPSAIAFSGKKILELDEKQFQIIIDWFFEFNIYIENYKERRLLVSEEMWDRYEKLGITGLQEQIKLNAARKLLVDRWRDRPFALRKRVTEDERQKAASDQRKAQQKNKASRKQNHKIR